MTLDREIAWSWKCVMLLCDLILIFVVLTLTFKSCLGYILETIRYRMLIPGRGIG